MYESQVSDYIRKLVASGENLDTVRDIYLANGGKEEGFDRAVEEIIREDNSLLEDNSKPIEGKVLTQSKQTILAEQSNVMAFTVLPFRRILKLILSVNVLQTVVVILVALFIVVFLLAVRFPNMFGIGK